MISDLPPEKKDQSLQPVRYWLFQVFHISCLAHISAFLPSHSSIQYLYYTILYQTERINWEVLGDPTPTPHIQPTGEWLLLVKHLADLKRPPWPSAGLYLQAQPLPWLSVFSFWCPSLCSTSSSAHKLPSASFSFLEICSSLEQDHISNRCPKSVMQEMERLHVLSLINFIVIFITIYSKKWSSCCNIT